MLLAVLLACRDRKEIVSVISGEEMITGRVVEANGLRMKLRVMDFFGRESEEEIIPLREIEILEIGTQEEQMYGILEEMEKERLTLLPSEPETIS